MVKQPSREHGPYSSPSQSIWLTIAFSWYHGDHIEGNHMHCQEYVSTAGKKNCVDHNLNCNCRILCTCMHETIVPKRLIWIGLQVGIFFHVTENEPCLPVAWASEETRLPDQNCSTVLICQFTHSHQRSWH